MDYSQAHAVWEVLWWVAAVSKVHLHLPLTLGYISMMFRMTLSANAFASEWYRAGKQSFISFFLWAHSTSCLLWKAAPLSALLCSRTSCVQQDHCPAFATAILVHSLMAIKKDCVLFTPSFFFCSSAKSRWTTWNGVGEYSNYHLSFHVPCILTCWVRIYGKSGHGC